MNVAVAHGIVVSPLPVAHQVTQEASEWSLYKIPNGFVIAGQSLETPQQQLPVAVLIVCDAGAIAGVEALQQVASANPSLPPQGALHLPEAVRGAGIVPTLHTVGYNVTVCV